jgi:prephenate dehydratase
LFKEEEIEFRETIKEVLEYASIYKLSAVVPIENSTVGLI